MNRKHIFFASFCHFCCDVNTGSLPAILPYLREAHGLSYSMTSGLMFANSGFSSVLQPIFGLVADRWPRLWYMPAGVLVAGCAMAATGVLSGYWALFLAIMTSGLGAALFHPAAVRFTNRVSGASKGEGMSIFSVGGNAGFLIAPLLAAGLISTFGLRGLLLLAPLALCAAAFSLRASTKLAKSAPAARAAGSAEDDRPNDWSSFAKLTLCVICRSTVVVCLRTFVPLYWIARFGQSAEQAALALTVYGTFGIIGNILGGKLADRVGELAVIRGNHLVLLPLLVCFPFVDSFALSYALLMVTGFVFFMSFSPLVILGQRYLNRNVGLASGITLGLGLTFGGIFAPVLGKAADLWGLEITFHLLALFVFVGVVTSFFLKAPRTAEAAEG